MRKLQVEELYNSRSYTFLTPSQFSEWQKCARQSPNIPTQQSWGWRLRRHATASIHSPGFGDNTVRRLQSAHGLAQCRCCRLANSYIKREEFEKVVESLRPFATYHLSHGLDAIGGGTLIGMHPVKAQTFKDAKAALEHAETILKSQRGEFTDPRPARNQSLVQSSEQCPSCATPSGTPDTSPSVPQSPSDTPYADRV